MLRKITTVNQRVKIKMKPHFLQLCPSYRLKSQVSSNSCCKSAKFCS